jgi:hypothetical protein
MLAGGQVRPPGNAEQASGLLAMEKIAVGGENARAMLTGAQVRPPGNAEQASGLLAMEKIAANAERVRALHKQRILDCMQAMTRIMRDAIVGKKNAIDEARARGARPEGPSDSELSSDDKGWQSSAEDGA